MIIRRTHNSRYTIVANQIADDGRLSFDALGLLTYLLSRPDNWNVHVNQLKGRGGCGRDKIRSLLCELIDAGYVRREQTRSDDGRHIKGVVYSVYDEPQEAQESAGQGPENPALEGQAPENQGPENQGPRNPSAVINKEDNNTGLEQERECAREEEEGEPDPETPEGITKRAEALFFRSFKGWDRFDVSPKQPMLNAWAKLTWAHMEAAADAVPRFLAGKKAAGMRHAPAISTYLDLNERLWEAFPPVVAPAVAPEPPKAAPWGPEWSQLLFGALLAGPVDPGPPTVTRESRRSTIDHLRTMFGVERAAEHARRVGLALDAAGEVIFPDDFEERLWREHIAENGWPVAKGLYEAARDRVRRILPEGFVSLKERMEAVPVGSAAWEAWQEFFARHDWPWLPDPGRQPVVWFPAGGPAGFGQFEQAMRDIEQHDRQAAE